MRVASGKKRVPSRNDKLRRNGRTQLRTPEDAAIRLLRSMVTEITSSAKPPTLRKRNLDVVQHRMIAREVQHKHDRNFCAVLADDAYAVRLRECFGYAIRENKKPVNERTRLVGLKPHPVLTTYRKTRERRAFLTKFRNYRLRRGRFLAVHLTGEDLEDLLAARRPFDGVLQLAPVGKSERVLKLVRSDLRLVVVRIARIGNNSAKYNRDNK